MRLSKEFIELFRFDLLERESSLTLISLRLLFFEVVSDSESLTDENASELDTMDGVFVLISSSSFCFESESLS